MLMRISSVPILLMLAAVLGGSVARSAEDVEPAKVEDLIRRAIDLRRSGHDNRAFPLLQEAYERAPSPRTAAQLGLVEMALGYKLEAERHLSEAVESRRDLWVNKNRSILESALVDVRAAIGEGLIQGPAGAGGSRRGNGGGGLPPGAALCPWGGATTLYGARSRILTPRR